MEKTEEISTAHVLAKVIGALMARMGVEEVEVFDFEIDDLSCKVIAKRNFEKKSFSFKIIGTGE